MKKTFLSVSALAAAALLTFSGCSAAKENSPAKNSSSSQKKLDIVCTIFPEYDWVKQIAGDKANISYLLESGVDLHNYQPTADDIIKISSCDLFLYVGGESDEWAEDAVKNASGSGMSSAALLDIAGSRVKTEELKEGMQPEEEEAGEKEEEEEYDEHIWLSVKDAGFICSELTDILCELDPDNAEYYRASFESYSGELSALDSEFEALAAGAARKTLVFGDRFPFRYFADDYGFDYYAPFPGCSAESEASFETVIFLAEKIDELGCGTVYTIENSDGKLARTIIESTRDKDQNTAVLNSLQSVSRSEADAGASYISLMRENYEVLKNTLS